MPSADDLWIQIMEVRERVARMESTLGDIKRTLDKQPSSPGSLVIPVGLATAIIQGGIALVQHFT